MLVLGIFRECFQGFPSSALIKLSTHCGTRVLATPKWIHIDSGIDDEYKHTLPEVLVQLESSFISTMRHWKRIECMIFFGKSPKGETAKQQLVGKKVVISLQGKNMKLFMSNAG